MNEPFFESEAWFQFLETVESVWASISFGGYVATGIAIFVLVYSVIRLAEVREKVEELSSDTTFEAEDERTDLARWEHVLSLAEGTRESDWRHAIIKADLMLEEILEEKGYQGATVEEKLAQASFETKEKAEEAHALRLELTKNLTFVLDERTTYRAIKNYEAVFEEFGEIPKH